MSLSAFFTSKLLHSLSSSSSSSSSSSHQNLYQAQLSLQTLLKNGFSPTLQNLNHHLLFLSKSHRFKSVINFFFQMNSNHIQGNSETHSIFTWALLKCHNFEAAHHFLMTHLVKTSTCPRNRMWDFLIQGFCIQQNDPEKALFVLKDGLRNYGMLPSSFTFYSLIHSFKFRGKMDRTIEVLELMSDEKIRYPFGNFICSSVISGFCKIGKSELAVEFFENAEKTGALRPNVVTYTALVTALCELGRVSEIDDLVCRMEKEGLGFDVVLYSSWILGYLKQGTLEDALCKYRQMVENGIEPDIISYTLLIDGFSKEGNVEKAVGLLNKMKNDGLEPSLVTYTAIMLGFCKKGKLDEALNVFKMVEDLGIEADEFLYATLIDGACRKKDFGRVFSLLEDMEKKKISPSIVTYNTVVNGLCKAGRTSEADEVSKGIVGDIVTYSTLLHGYIEEENMTGMLETKKRLEEVGVCMDVIAYNILIKALFMVGEFEDAYKTYKGMPRLSLAPDAITYCTLIGGYCRVGRIDEALEIFDDFRRTSISSTACYASVIHGLCRKNMVTMAIEVFSESIEKGLALDVGTYRMLIKAIFDEQSAVGVIYLFDRTENLVPEIYDIVGNHAICFVCKQSYFEAACNIHMIMRTKGLITSSKSYYSILRGLIGKGKDWLYLPIFNNFLKEYGFHDHRVCKILVHYLCVKNTDKALWFILNVKKTLAVTFPVPVLKTLIEKGRALDAYKLVMGAEDNLPTMDVVDYSTLVDGLCKGGHLDKALDLCFFVQKKEISLNIITYNSVIDGLRHQGCLIEAFRLLDSLEKIGLVSEITYAMLIDALCKEGFLLDARQLFDRMVLKGLNLNIRIYNSLINGCCKFHLMNEALKFLHDLESRCLEPDEFTICAVINGYCLEGDMEGALGFFFEFKRKGKLPDLLGFLYLIRGLCAKGRMEEARTILREMLQTPSVLELINRVDAELETESIEGFLSFLCEQGSIKEAVTVLDEVGRMVLPVRTSFPSRWQKTMEVIQEDDISSAATKFPTSPHKLDLDLVRNGKEIGEVVKRHGGTEKIYQLHDLIASFCSRGDLLKANRLVKEMLFHLNGGFN